MSFGIVLLYMILAGAQGSNILFILPYPAPSHFNCFYPLMVKLIENGHNVTAVTATNPKNENLTLIELHGVQKYFPVSFASFRSQSRFENMLITFDVGTTFAQGAMYHENFQQFLNNDDLHFDVVLVEIYYCDAYLALARKFNAPVIGLVPQTLPPIYGWLTNNPIDFSYIPNMYLPYTNEMDFVKRVINAIFGIVHILAYQWRSFFINQDTIDKHFPYLENKQRNLQGMFQDISLTLVNTHYSIGYARPFLPNVIEVAGIHLKSPKSLPSDIQQFLDDASDGAVYISFGTMVQQDVIAKWGQVILNVFKKLPLRVLLKWNSTTLSDIPSNFLIQSWFPQNDILHHPNIKLFISHGGVHSLIESVNAGVPIIGVPFFSDQYLNTGIAEKLGFGISLSDVNQNDLEKAVKSILENSIYQKNVNQRSQLFKERLVNPVNTAAFWVEHVIRHKGAPHLNSGASKLTWYQYLLLDVMAFFIICLIIVILTLKFFFQHMVLYLKRVMTTIIYHMNNRIGKKKKIH